jgi:thioredoxin 1
VTTIIEFFYAPGCKRCVGARDELRGVADALPDLEVRWMDVNVAEQPTRAVDAGVIGTPAMAINGRLVFPRVPSPEELRKALRHEPPTAP